MRLGGLRKYEDLIKIPVRGLMGHPAEALQLKSQHGALQTATL